MFILQNLILRTRLCGTGFITQPVVFLISTWRICQVEMICIGGVPVLKRHFGGAGPLIFYMIHRGGRPPKCSLMYARRVHSSVRTKSALRDCTQAIGRNCTQIIGLFCKRDLTDCTQVIGLFCERDLRDCTQAIGGSWFAGTHSQG